MSKSTKELLRAIKDDEELAAEDTIEEEAKEETDLIELDKVEETMLKEYAGESLFRFIKTPIARRQGFELTKEQRQRLHHHVANLRTGTYALVPLICKGFPMCPLIGVCPMVETKEDGTIDVTESNFPLLQQCPVEAVTMQAKIIDLCKEYKINPEDTTDIAIITKIAELDIYDHRLSMQLAKEEGQSLLIDSVTQVDQKSGAVYSEMKLHPAIDAKEKIAKQKDNLLRSMVGTRMDKARVNKDKQESSDAVQKMTELMTAIKKIQEGEVIDGDYEEVTNEHKGD